MEAALEHRQPALLVEVALREAPQDRPDHVAQLKLVLVLSKKSSHMQDNFHAVFHKFYVSISVYDQDPGWISIFFGSTGVG